MPADYFINLNTLNSHTRTSIAAKAEQPQIAHLAHSICIHESYRKRSQQASKSAVTTVTLAAKIFHRCLMLQNLISFLQRLESNE